MKKSAHSYDVIIIGAGMTGMTLALGLVRQKIKVAVIEGKKINTLLAKDADGRVSAIAYGSQQVLDQYGIWQAMKAQSEPILDIRITDDHMPFFLHYDHQMVGDDPMGYIVENAVTNRALFEVAKKAKGLTILDGVKCKNIVQERDGVKVDLEDDTTITGRLLVGADGKFSRVRHATSIKTTSLDYKQQGIVCTIAHEKHHQNVAVEHFLPAGPFAVLPMHGGYHSSLVWTEKAPLVKHYMDMPDDLFVDEITYRTGDYLGAIKVEGKRFSYPLTLSYAEDFYEHRIVLVGDAAHAIHPIAGQGWNLGIRDVEALVNVMSEAKEKGLDIGSQQVLEQYQQMRRFDTMAMIKVTDTLNRLFSNKITPLKYARDLGMTAVNHIPPLKRFFIRHAMGVR